MCDLKPDLIPLSSWHPNLLFHLHKSYSLLIYQADEIYLLIYLFTCYLTYLARFFIKNLPVYSPCIHKKSINYFWLGGFPIYSRSSISANRLSSLNVYQSLKICLMFFTINPKNQQMLIPHLVLLPLIMYLNPRYFQD